MTLLVDVFYLFPFLQCHFCSGLWNLYWSDEFNGPTIDSTKWTHDIGMFYNNELEFYTNSPDNSYISEGSLIIKALNQSGNYTSARLNTQGKFSTQYGKFEMRAKLPYGQGMWPAFWLLGNQGPWPACGEIDIMEFIGKTPAQVYSSLHATNFNTENNYTYSGGFSNDFHNYTLYWENDLIQFAFDGNLFTNKTRKDAQIISGNWPFDATGYGAYIILNLAVGGDWPGNPDSTTIFPQYYTIDYVRVYKWSGASSMLFSPRIMILSIIFGLYILG